MRLRLLGLATCLAVTGCSHAGQDHQIAEEGPVSAAHESVVPTLTGPSGTIRPRSLAQGAPLRVQVDATLAPLAMRSQDGSGYEGAEVDLIRAVAQRWGVEVEFVDVFGAPASGSLTETGSADVGIGGIPPRTDHGLGYQVVPVLRAGPVWAVRAGNPKGLSPVSMCGQAVAVQGSSALREDLLQPYERTCQEQGNPLRLMTYAGQDQATAALVANKVQAMVAPGPVVEYAVKAAPNELESLGQEDLSARLGIAVRTDDETFAPALRQALAELRADGTLADIMGRFDLGSRDLAAPLPSRSPAATTPATAPATASGTAGGR